MSTETAVVRVAMPISVAGVSDEQYARMDRFREDLEFNLPAIMAVLPKGVRAEALASTALAATLDSPKLLDCTALSLFRAVYKAAALNLRIGETCDIVGPLKGKAECWVRVKGVVELAKRAGAIQWARVGAVCEGEVFEYEERGDGTHFRHVPSAVASKDGANVTHIYAALTLPTGLRVYEVWTIAKCLDHKARFAKDTKPGSAWAEHPLAMMSKSVVKAALRFAPLSPDMQRAIASGDEDGGAVASLDNPTEALALASGALDAMETMEDAEVVAPEPMTLADAESMILPGAATAWGGHGGQTLGALKDAMLSQVARWVAKDPVRVVKFSGLAMACDIIVDAREDMRSTGELAEEAA